MKNIIFDQRCAEWECEINIVSGTK